MAAVGYRDVLAYWFGSPGDPDYGKPRAAWFNKDEAADSEIRSRFRALHMWAHSGLLDAWDEQADSALALTIVLDQFSRQLYRQSPRAFAQNGMALVLAQEAVAAGVDRQLAGDRRAFLYMPYMHAESLVVQQAAVPLFAALGGDEFSKAGAEHLEVLARFGRFPKRNAALGRTSTPAEVTYLAEIGDRMF